jgi:hypothetical protein
MEDFVVHTKMTLIDESIRNTAEYKEARDLFARKCEFNAYLKQIDSDLMQLRRLSPIAFKIAKTDLNVKMLRPVGEVMQDRNRNCITSECAPDGLQQSSALRLVTNPPTQPLVEFNAENRVD